MLVDMSLMSEVTLQAVMQRGLYMSHIEIVGHGGTCCYQGLSPMWHNTGV
jgi:hypothetical protein